MSTIVQNHKRNQAVPYFQQNDLVKNTNNNKNKSIEIQEQQLNSERSTNSSFSSQNIDQIKNKNSNNQILQNKNNNNQLPNNLPPRTPLTNQQQSKIQQQQKNLNNNNQNEQILVEKMPPTLKFPQTVEKINQLLPMQIASLRIKKVTWNDFKGIPNQNESYSAHIYWYITYSYDMKMKPLYNKQVEYQASVNTAVSIREKSWNKKTVNELLLHEQGHYLLGCLCALEFEKKCKEFTFTNNYKQEITRIFNANLKEWLQRERDYDDETEHRLNFKEQERWDRYIINKLSEFHNFFESQNNKKKRNFHYTRKNSLKENINRNYSNNNRSGSVKNRQVLKIFNSNNSSQMSNGSLNTSYNNGGQKSTRNNNLKLPSINNLDKKWKL